MSNVTLCPECRQPGAEYTGLDLLFCQNQGCTVVDFTPSGRIALLLDPEGVLQEQPEAEPAKTNSREARHSSAKQEWGTPEPIIELARSFMGQIDLDPASSPEHNERVKAGWIYTEQDNGILQSWKSRSLWLNPPYGKIRLPYPMVAKFQGRTIWLDEGKEHSSQAVWVYKLLSEYEAGSFVHAMLLVNAETAAAWFQPLWSFPICFIRGRVKFIDPDTGKPGGSPTHGSALIYLGSRSAAAFARHMRELGPVAVSMAYSEAVTGDY